MKPSVAIAILNYNGKGYLQQFLPFVTATTYSNKSIWVIDNASTDNSLDFLQLHYPKVRVISLDKNYGFAEGYNRGLKEITSDYYVLLNSDVEVTPNFIEPVIEVMEKDLKIAFAQPKLLSLQNRHLFEYAGAAGGLIDAIGYPFCRGRVLETVETDEGQYDDIKEVFWATGACLFAKADVYWKLDGMYNFLYMQNEDIDLCWRAQNQDYKILACGNSAVYHKGGGSLGWDNPRKVFFTFRNNLIMITRNMPIGRLFWILPFRHFVDSAAAFHYFFKGNWRAGGAVFKGIAAFWKWLVFSGKEKWPRKRGVKHLNTTLPKWIIWEYFVKNHKTYSKLNRH